MIMVARTRTSVMVLVGMLILASIAPASAFTITNHGAGVQIWIQAEDYDSKTPEYDLDINSVGASNKAMYFPSYSPRTVLDEWWGEYSIDSTDPNFAEVDLSGTWYAWVRVNQPTANSEEANYLFVKGHDGTGASWYDTALSSVDDIDDMIANEAAQAGAAGIGNWKWMGQSAMTQGLAKDFIVDENNKIVFRINVREGGPGNVRIDAVCWTNDPGYIPGDVDFGQAPIADGLVFEMNAAHPGNKATTYWKPVLPDVADEYQGRLIDQTMLIGESAEEGTNWFYRFTPHSTMRDQVVGIANYVDFSFINDDWCTIEAWIRVPALIPNSKTKSTIFGNVYTPGETGWRFGVRSDPATGKYSLEFFQRDNETDQTTLQGIFHYRTTNFLEYSATDWVHIVFVKYAAEYDDVNSRISINHDWYANGELVSHGVRTLTADSIDDFYFQPQAPWIGATREDSNLAGDVALLRVYNRLLYPNEVLANYNAGITSAKAFQCGGVIEGDINGDCKADIEDFIFIARNWLEDNTVYPIP